jgi:hypothetical protein
MIPHRTPDCDLLDRAPTLQGMGFRVPTAGPRHFTDYPTLRAALDALLVNRLPDVELLTCGGHYRTIRSVNVWNTSWFDPSRTVRITS